MSENDREMLSIERLLYASLPRDEVREWIHAYSSPYQELMAYYRCAMMEVVTKFNVLNEEFSLSYDRNPIESIKSRLKSPMSILEKIERKGLYPSLESIEGSIHDIAGVRVICSYVSDIYMLADAFSRQDDVHILYEKDYIRQPKENGYRSYHLIAQIPIFLHDQKKYMKVEVQFRTLSMDWWATLEHKISYKKDAANYPEIMKELRECADIGASLDERMAKLQSIHTKTDPDKTN